MDIAILLHLYQPPIQDPAVLRQVASECYLPLINSIQKNKFNNLTFNIPLSILEQMDKEGYSDWVSSIRNLNSSGKIELTGSGAYHPLLTKIPDEIIQEQIILNEYGLGYYFGSTQGFEGEEAMIIQDLNGFFPPELAINMHLVQQLDELNYSWVLADEVAFMQSMTLNGDNCLYELKNIDTKIVKRDTALSNLISFKRDLDTSDVKEYLQKKKEERCSALVIALDGETFGHHDKDGMILFELLVKLIKDLGINLVKVSDIVDGYEDIMRVEEINESSWGVSAENIKNGSPYPFWTENRSQDLLWELQDEVIDYYISQNNKKTSKINDYQNAPIWKEEVLNEMNEDLAFEIRNNLIFQKSLNSDKFWWASKKEVGDKELYDPGFIKKSLSLFSEYAKNTGDEKFINKVQKRISEIEDVLK